MKHTFQKVLSEWKVELNELYDESEIKSIYRIALEDILGVSDPVLKMRSGDDLSEIQLFHLAETLKRLKNAEPIQHIAGFTFFDGLKIEVSQNVLIPRPETEELVHWIVDVSKNAARILDICTGSGCIALALKNRIPQASVTASDLSDPSLQLAKLNAQNHHLSVDFVKDDALVSSLGGTFDVIVSNPPYIPLSERQSMHPNVVEFEPDMALFVPDNDPLLFYREITRFANKHLSPGGKLFFELHENYADDTRAMVENTDSFKEIEVRLDLQGKSRMLRAVKS